KRAGKVRDMDVLTSDAASVQVPDEQDCAVRLLQHLVARRYDYARRLRAELLRRVPRIRPHLKCVASRIVKRISEPRRNSRPASPRQIARRSPGLVTLAASLKSLPSLNHKNLHPYRLKVKELRDVLRLSEKPSNQKFIDVLGQVKDAIGDWHDW